MTDRFSVIPIDKLLQILLYQFDHKGSVFGIPKDLFFTSKSTDPFRIKHFGEELESPIGVAAGSHTQLSHNIVISWLMGARFIELKTIQTLDELEISKPCIDMEDEGYNCEWSQELKIHESFEQYLDAWIIIHVLRHKLLGKKSGHPGFSFNMSIGYNLEGIMKENVQWYLNKMSDASEMLEEKRKILEEIYPDIQDIEIDPKLSNHITLSTMHGCPPDEIEKIGEYLISERKLHTAIKLNPTLLGADAVRSVLSDAGFETHVPDLAFEHDLKFEDACKILSNLLKRSAENKVEFGIKLTNTLESKNHKSNFPNEEMMYMSGRALHPISVNLAAKLQNVFKGELNISFSGGANAENIRDLYECGLNPVTVCTDLLKPGGYGRLAQYIDALRRTKDSLNTKNQLQLLNTYAESVLNNLHYKKIRLADKNLKTGRELSYFDCIQAPCISSCSTHQDIPGYLHFTKNEEFENAYDIIRNTNPFPLTTGMICDHLCQNKCVRLHYDEPVRIRDVKRFIAEYANDNKLDKSKKPGLNNNKKVAVVGAGPSGMSCGYYLAKNGIEVEIFEQKPEPGGMISHAIPSFRLTDESIRIDINHIKKMGVQIHYGSEIIDSSFQQLRERFDAIFVGAGAQKSAKLFLKGIDTAGVLDPLKLLFDVKSGDRPNLGKNVVIIGGGNTAMDAARTALRLIEPGGKVSILYRRTIKQMPADQGEIKAVIDEGSEILELLNPVEIISKAGRIHEVKCQAMKLGPADASGRPKPIPVKDLFRIIPADFLIPAIGQETAFGFLSSDDLQTGKYETKIPGVFIGGDALRGASTAINAIGDGRKSAMEIITSLSVNKIPAASPHREKTEPTELMLHKSKRMRSMNKHQTTKAKLEFEILVQGLTKEEAVYEASRCLKCDEICNLCVTVCPNLAFHPYEVKPKNLTSEKVCLQDGNIKIVRGPDLNISQEHQILHISDWCNECGNCTSFCPTSGAPYKEKPHLYLKKSIFHAEKDGFFTSFESENPTIHAYFDNCLFTLSQKNDHWIFRGQKFELILDLIDFRIKEITTMETDKEIHTNRAQIMYMILEGTRYFYNNNQEIE